MVLLFLPPRQVGQHPLIIECTESVRSDPSDVILGLTLVLPLLSEQLKNVALPSRAARQQTIFVYFLTLSTVVIPCC